MPLGAFLDPIFHLPERVPCVIKPMHQAHGRFPGPAFPLVLVPAPRSRRPPSPRGRRLSSCLSVLGCLVRMGFRVASLPLCIYIPTGGGGDRQRGRGMGGAAARPLGVRRETSRGELLAATWPLAHLGSPDPGLGTPTPAPPPPTLGPGTSAPDFSGVGWLSWGGGWWLIRFRPSCSHGHAGDAE